METATYPVSGMTCDHCVSAVKTEVANIDGVVDVDIDLATGAVTVASERPIDDGIVRAAVEEAGYRVTS
jgi:copper chaperone